jgi:hypothetical protein
MSILSQLDESVNLNRLKGLNCTEVMNAFFANYLATLVILRLQDLQGLMLINDRNHSKLNTFSINMSDLNFWGKALFYPDADVKGRMLNDQGNLMAALTKPITKLNVQKLMFVQHLSPEDIIWTEIIAALILLKRRLRYQSSYFDTILKTVLNWDSTNNASKQKAVNNVFMYLLQSDPNSRLVTWFRSQSATILIKKVTPNEQKIISFRRLAEDEGCCADAGGTAVSTGNIASNAIVNPQDNQNDTSLDGLFKLVKRAPNQVEKKKGKYKINNGKIVVKRKKNFNPKKFTAPDFLKAKKVEKKETEDEVK